jgi:hypothetical protein
LWSSHVASQSNVQMHVRSLRAAGASTEDPNGKSFAKQMIWYSGWP